MADIFDTLGPDIKESTVRGDVFDKLEGDASIGVVGGGGRFRGAGASGNLPVSRKEMTIGGFAENIGENIVDIASGVVSAVRHPVETGKGLATLAAGAISAAVPDVLQTEKSPEIAQAEEMARGLGRQLKAHISDPVGTIYEHPVDILSVLSPALQGAGVIAKTGGMARTANVLSKTAQVVEPTQVATLPIKVAGKVVANIPPLRGLGLNLYASALKPRLSKGKDNLANTLKTVQENLDKGRTVSQKVWRATQKEINRYKDDVKKVIDKGTARGDTINIRDVVDNLDNLKKDTAFADVRPDLLERAVDRTKNALIKYHDIKSGGKLTPRQVQNLKVRQWDAVQKQFGQLNVAYKADIQKSLGHGAKKSLEALYPELKELNIPMGELLEFNGHLEKALKSHLLSDEVRNLAFMIKAVVDNPTAKSKVAIWLRRARKGNPLANPKALEKNLLIQLGRVEATQNQEPPIEGEQ